MKNLIQKFNTDKLSDTEPFLSRRTVRPHSFKLTSESPRTLEFDTQFYIRRTIGYFGLAAKEGVDSPLLAKEITVLCVLKRVARLDGYNLSHKNRYLTSRLTHLREVALNVLDQLRYHSSDPVAFDLELISTAIYLKSPHSLRLVVDFFKQDLDAERAQLLADTCRLLRGQLHNYLRMVIKDSGYLPLLTSTRSASEILDMVDDFYHTYKPLPANLARHPYMSGEQYDI